MMAAGAIVGQYRVIRQVGEGGMGAVFLAEHTLIGRRAAIKMLLPSLSAQTEIVERFFNEARATTAMTDPGIVQVFDFGVHTDGSAYLVMEFLEGDPLEARIRSNGRLPVPESLRIARQVATSLGAAHARGIVHRDLKPENIFLVPDPEAAGGERPKVLDFGIAKLASDEPNRMRTRTGALMGTPIYMSPEQCRGAGGVDHRSDIYSLGCVLYTMVTGHPPFDRLGTGEIIAAHLHEPVVPPRQLVPYLAPAAEQLIMRCLAKAPEERYASMIELAAALEHVLAHISGSAAAAAMPTVAMTPLPPGFRSEYPRAAATQARSTPGSVTGHPGPAQSPYAGHSGHIEVSVVRPTTLSQASGHVATRPPAAPRSSRPGVWIAAVLVLVAIGGGVAVVAGRGGADGAASSEPRDTSFAAAPPAAPRPPSAPSLVVQAPSTTAGVTVDAGVDAAAPVAVAPTTTSPAAAAPSTTPSTTTPAITTPSATAASANAPATAPAAASTKKTRPGRHAASKAGSGSSSEELYDTR